MARSVDIPERQLPVFFSEDRSPWHQGIASEQVSQAKWVVVALTDMEVTDVDEVADFPSEELPESCKIVYTFDQVTPRG